jgi:YD repeat-containing protein
MKQLFLILMVLLSIATFSSHSQVILHYSYDDAGNRIERTVTIGEKSKGTMVPENLQKEVKEVINDDAFSPQVIKIYPNPTKGMLEVEVPIDDENSFTIQLIVVDINGKIIFDRKDVPSKTTIDLSSNPDGLYVLYIKQGQKVSKWKIIKR